MNTHGEILMHQTEDGLRKTEVGYLRETLNKRTTEGGRPYSRTGLPVVFPCCQIPPE